MQLCDTRLRGVAEETTTFDNHLAVTEIGGHCPSEPPVERRGDDVVAITIDGDGY